MSRNFLTRFSSFSNHFKNGLGKRSVDATVGDRRASLPSETEGGATFDESAMGPLTVYRHRAMACDFEVSVNEADAAREEPFAVFDLIDRQEETLSVFRATSLVSRINLLAAEMDIPLPRSLFEQLVLCRHLWEETDGAFDITASPLWKQWGFARGEGRVPTPAEIDEALGKVGMQHLILNEERLTVAFDVPGVEINFGAIGKGFALDEATSFLSRSSLDDYLIHGGMSSAVARGGRLRDQVRDRKGEVRPCWTIGVADPLRPEHRLATLRLVDEAVGTGGSGRQYFFHRGKRLSHIIDPKTGYPAVGVLSATVVASSAAEADALSTAFFVMGAEKTEMYAQKHPDCGALLVLDSPTGKQDIVTFNIDHSRCRIE